MKTYTIKKGSHYSNHLPRPYLGIKKVFCMNFLFDDSCRYSIGIPDQLDINKLPGVSFGHHHENSIRSGWNYNVDADLITLYSYHYNNGYRFYKAICHVEIGVKTPINLILRPNSYLIESKDLMGQVCIQKNQFQYPSIRLGYYLFPYFGGNKPAPHDINIKMEVK